MDGESYKCYFEKSICQNIPKQLDSESTEKKEDKVDRGEGDSEITEGIPFEEDYHDSMEGESYKCYFEKSMCQNIPKQLDSESTEKKEDKVDGGEGDSEITEGIPFEEDYYDSMDGESYKCYFEKSICQNIPKQLDSESTEKKEDKVDGGEGDSEITEGIPFEEDYYDSMDGESYKCYFGKSICQNIPKHLVIVTDNAPYHSKKHEKLPH